MNQFGFIRAEYFTPEFLGEYTLAYLTVAAFFGSFIGGFGGFFAASSTTGALLLAAGWALCGAFIVIHGLLWLLGFLFKVVAV